MRYICYLLPNFVRYTLSHSLRSQIMREMKESNLKGVVEQLKADIDQMSRQTRGLKNGERFKSVRKLNDLRNILTKIEEIDRSVDHLIKEQHQKRVDQH